VNFGGKPIHPPKLDKDGKPMAGPLNRRAEMWSLSKRLAEDEGGADIPDERRDPGRRLRAWLPLHAGDPAAGPRVQGRHQEAAQNLPSPDEWDAIALTFAEPVTDNRGPKPLAMPDLGIV
jgi:hypothetical protein